MSEDSHKVVAVEGKRYSVGSVIGKGATCTVYSGRNIETDERVAIREYTYSPYSKIILTDFRHGIRVHRMLNPESDRFPRLYGAEGKVSIAEYVDGWDLGKFYFQPEDVVLANAHQISMCLEEFHRSGNGVNIVHMDVKPGNVIARNDGRSVLIDFDFSWIDDGQPFECIGTPAYLSPEHINGTKPLPISDIYSLGLTLYKLYSGMDRLVESKGLPDNVDDMVFEDEDKIIEKIKSSRDVREVVSTCLRVGRSYESAEHMRKEIEERLAKFDVRPEQTKDVVAGWLRKRCLN